MGTTVGLWATLSFKGTDAMVAWLTAIGFEEHAMYRDEQDSGVVEHAEMLWPTGGGIMFGSDRDNPDWPSPAGAGATYLVTDDVDRVHDAAVRAGATTLRAPRDEEYGGRGATVRDPEGNLWSFGSHRPV
jgi:uncharacterized glyoxalase superfamily protein PhnB